MRVRRTSVALALASFLALPALASAAIVQKWQGSNYGWVPEVKGDLDGNGSFELVTIEPASGGVFKVGIRSGSTGALLTQTATTYLNPENFLYADVDSDGDVEILFTNASTNMVCLNYTAGSLAVRFNYQPSPALISEWDFADLDGNGHLYMVFKDISSGSNNYYVRDYNGVAVTTLTPVNPPSAAQGWTRSLIVDDFDADGRSELLIDYHHASQGDVLYVYESNSPGPAQPAANRAPISRAGRPVEPVFVDGSR